MLRSESQIMCTHISPNGNCVAYGTLQNEYGIYNVRQNSIRKFVGDDKKVEIRSVIFSPDSKLLGVVSSNLTLRIVDADTLQCFQLVSVDSEWAKVQFSHDHSMFSWCYFGESLEIRSTYCSSVKSILVPTSKIEPNLCEADPFGNRFLDAFAFSPNNKYLACACYDGNVYLLDIDRSAMIRCFDRNFDRWKSDFVKTVVFLPDGLQVAFGAISGSVELFDVESGKQTHAFCGHKTFVQRLAFLKDSFASLSYGSNVQVWNIAGGELKKSFTVDDYILDAVEIALLDDETLVLVSASHYGLQVEKK